MASNRKDLSIPWPFAPNRVAMNKDQGLLHLIAMITMLCDHAGVVIFPRVQLLRYIGRLAFPIFAYCTACGCVYTRSPLKYLKRLVILALITQPIYAFTMNHRSPLMFAYSFTSQPVRAVLNFIVMSWANHPSILFTLILGLLVCWSIRERQLVFTAALAVFVILVQRKIDYGWEGVALIALFYLCCQRTWISLPCILAFMLWWAREGNSVDLFGARWSIQIYAIPALIPIYLNTNTRIRIPKWFNYAFYPAHMAALYCVAQALKIA